MFPKEKFEVQIGMVSKESDKRKGELYQIWLCKMIIVSSMSLRKHKTKREKKGLECILNS